MSQRFIRKKIVFIIDVLDAEENVDCQKFAISRISATCTRNKSNITKLEERKERQEMLALKANELGENETKLNNMCKIGWRQKRKNSWR